MDGPSRPPLRWMRRTGAPGPALEVRVDLFEELFLRPRSDDAGLLLALAEEDQRRDRQDPELLDDARVVVGVELHDHELPGLLLRDVLDDGVDGSARRAPLSPEVHENGCV